MYSGYSGIAILSNILSIDAYKFLAQDRWLLHLHDCVGRLWLICSQLIKKYLYLGVPIVAQWKWTRVVSMRMGVWSLASFSRLRMRHCHELWCRLQMWLGSGIAVTVAEAGRYSSNSTPSLGTFCATYAALKRQTDRQTDRKTDSYLEVSWRVTCANYTRGHSWITL